MSKISLRLIVLALSTLVTFNLYAASVWKVSKGDDHLYIGGTVHLLSADDYPLPEQYKRAYDASDLLVFETDMAALQTPEFQQKSMMKMTFQDGTKISDVLNAETLAALEKHFTARNVPFANLQTFKPSLMYVTLSVIEMQIMGLTAQGVDQYFSTIALGDGKTQSWLETPDEQLDFLTTLDNGDPNALVSYTLNDLKSLPENMDKMIKAWRSGDMKALEDVGITTFKKDFPEIYDNLLVKRNNNWMPQIEAQMKTKDVEFVLVGALHLAGDDSVLKMLKDKGYTIEAF